MTLYPTQRRSSVSLDLLESLCVSNLHANTEDFDGIVQRADGQSEGSMVSQEVTVLPVYCYAKPSLEPFIAWTSDLIRYESTR